MSPAELMNVGRFDSVQSRAKFEHTHTHTHTHIHIYIYIYIYILHVSGLPDLRALSWMANPGLWWPSSGKTRRMRSGQKRSLDITLGIEARHIRANAHCHAEWGGQRDRMDWLVSASAQWGVTAPWIGRFWGGRFSQVPKYRLSGDQINTAKEYVWLVDMHSPNHRANKPPIHPPGSTYPPPGTVRLLLTGRPSCRTMSSRAWPQNSTATQTPRPAERNFSARTVNINGLGIRKKKGRFLVTYHDSNLLLWYNQMKRHNQTLTPRELYRNKWNTLKYQNKGYIYIYIYIYIYPHAYKCVLF